MQKNDAQPVQATLSTREDTVPLVSQLLDRVGEAYRVPADALTDLRIAMDEVITNVLKYAYNDDKAHEISIHCVRHDRYLETTIEDDGVAYNPLLAPKPDVGTPLATRRVGGLGVHFVKALMNEITYERVGDRNRLTLRQDLGEAGSGA